MSVDKYHLLCLFLNIYLIPSLVNKTSQVITLCFYTEYVILYKPESMISYNYATYNSSLCILHDRGSM